VCRGSRKLITWLVVEPVDVDGAVRGDDIDAWQATADWEPTNTFDQYVESYTNSEFDITERTTEGGTTYVRSYVYGGVDLTSILFEEVPDERFTANFAGLPEGVERSLTEPSPGDDATVLLGSPTPRQAAGLGLPELAAAPCQQTARPPGTMLVIQPLPAPCPADLIPEVTRQVAFDAAYKAGKQQRAVFIGIKLSGRQRMVKADTIHAPGHVIKDSVQDAIRAAVVRLVGNGEIGQDPPTRPGLLRAVRRAGSRPRPRARRRPVR
jgi:hypothetical protein